MALQPTRRCLDFYPQHKHSVTSSSNFTACCSVALKLQGIRKETPDIELVRQEHIAEYARSKSRLISASGWYVAVPCVQHTVAPLHLVASPGQAI